MPRNHYFFKVLIILLFFNLTIGVYSQDNLVKDLIDPYCQSNNIDEFFKDKKIKNIETDMKQAQDKPIPSDHVQNTTLASHERELIDLKSRLQILEKRMYERNVFND